MKVLIIEATPATPHAETGLEIAIKEKLSGSSVVYAPIFHLLPILVWRSNINGRRLEAGADSLEDWIAYLVSQVKDYAEIDVFNLNTVPDYLTEEIRRDPFGFHYEGHDFGALVKSNAVQLFNTVDCAQIISTNYGACLLLAQTAILSYNIALFLLERHGPELVYFFNGRTIGSWPIYLACRKRGVRTIIHERGATKDKYSLWARPPQYQEILKEEIHNFSLGRSADVARHAAATFYFRQKRGKTTNYGFNNQNQDHDAIVCLEGLSDKYVVYLTSSNSEIFLMPGQDVRNALGSQEDAVATLAQVCRQVGVQLIIKMHPGTPEAERHLYDHLSNGTACIVVSPSSKISSYRLAEGAYRNISYGSTITWELLYYGIHCAVLSDTIGRGEAGVVELASAEDIKSYLQSDLGAVDSGYAVKFADFMSNYGVQFEYFHAETLFAGVFSDRLDGAK
ncbi:MAG: hypothetical protein WCO60_04880 [Verrucomicrobiota bacterium]